VVGGGRVGEARWLLALDSLIQMIVEKHVLHIQPMNRLG